ncbi:MAG TPA: hypothetical protein PKN30_01310 [Flavobacteriales bacterium]|nr:hypothetical protein [Flavobacteriales bacterium]
MERFNSAAATMFAFLAPLLAGAQGAAITMDGLFDDWSGTLTTWNDATVPSSGLDLISMQVTNDQDHLFIKLELGTETDLLDDLTPHGIRLYIDGDNNAATGLAVQSGYGAELQIRFDTRTVTEYFGTSSNVSWSTLDLVPLPTVTSTVFEIAIARNARPDGTNLLFSSSTIGLLIRETDGGDAMPDAGSVLSYTFDDAFLATTAAIPLMRLDPEAVRVTAWNVLGDGITDPALQGPYQRILSALAPDIIGFSECVTSTPSQVKSRLDAWIPIDGNGWQVVKDDFDMVIASRWPILTTWTHLNRQFAALIDLPATYATDLLFTAAHLNCCTADAARQAQLDAYVQFVQDARAPGGLISLPSGTPMVYAGDLNSVGWAQQLNTLETGDIQDNGTYGPDGPMDWDGSGLDRAPCRQNEARMAYTWRNNNSAYPCGMLDHLYFTGAVAELMGSFALRTASMSASTLLASGLEEFDSSLASDHLPLTADLALPMAGMNVVVRAILDGPFVPGTGLMHDSLRTRALIPITEPYSALGFERAGSAGETIDNSLLTVIGPNAIVDWLLVELRSPTDPTMVLATQAGLVQRDGDVVAADGSPALHFTSSPAPFHIAVRHRNHLGVMTAGPIAPVSGTLTVDFTDPATDLHGTGAAVISNGTMRLWAGNALRDGVLRYAGLDNDRDRVLTRIGGVIPTNVVDGYAQEDLNCDGSVKYSGANNDRDLILYGIGGSVPTNTRQEQLP